MRQQGLFRRTGRDVFFFRYKDASGIWRTKSTGTDNRAEATAFKTKFDEHNAAGTLPTKAADRTVAQACTLWCQQHILNSMKARANERSSLRILLRAPFASKKLKTLKLDDLKNYQAERSRTVGPRPINIELAILIRVLKEGNLWTRSFSEHYKRLAEPESDIGRALTDAELARLDTVASSNDAWMVGYNAEVLAVNTGMRGGEIKVLRLGNIDLERRRIIVRRDGTKSDAGARLVELNNFAMAAAARLYQRAEVLGASAPDHYLLPADLSRHTKACDPLRGGTGFDVTRHQVSWSGAWRNLCKAAGLSRIRFHDLRHTFISTMGENGVPLQVVSAMVGHMSPRMTRHYTHISNNAARKAVEMLEQKRSDFGANFGAALERQDHKLLN
jgi:integrase